VNARWRMTLLGVALGAAAGASAGESAFRLKDGPDAVMVRAYCSSCHSADYIEMNSRFMKKANWDAEVRKMIKVMGAPVPEADVARIVEYLTQFYGVD
jgi:hypothetical protein